MAAYHCHIHHSPVSLQSSLHRRIVAVSYDEVKSLVVYHIRSSFAQGRISHAQILLVIDLSVSTFTDSSTLFSFLLLDGSY